MQWCLSYWAYARRKLNGVVTRERKREREKRETRERETEREREREIGKGERGHKRNHLCPDTSRHAVMTETGCVKRFPLLMPLKYELTVHEQMSQEFADKILFFGI